MLWYIVSSAMKDEILHTKIPGDVYKKLKQLADRDHRTIHSLTRHLLILAVEHEWRIRDDKPQ